MKKMIVLITLALSAAACGEPQSKNNGSVELNNGNPNNGENNGANNGGSDAGNNGGADMMTEPDLIMEDGGPVFVNLSASPTAITQGGTVSIIAQLTDPDGFDDIGGGRLIDADGNVFGNFNGSGGSYDLMLSWNQINDIESISFETSSTKTFIAEFFDAGGLKSQMTVAVELNCGGEPACLGICGESLCDNTCFEVFETDENCGGCGVTCAGNETCFEEACTVIAENYLEPCTSVDMCDLAGTSYCESFFTDAPTCITECGSDADCRNAICHLDFNVCMVECSNNPNVCDAGTTCREIEDRTVCIPEES